jgi:hypothetical protein
MKVPRRSSGSPAQNRRFFAKSLNLAAIMPRPHSLRSVDYAGQGTGWRSLSELRQNGLKGKILYIGFRA